MANTTQHCKKAVVRMTPLNQIATTTAYKTAFTGRRRTPNTETHSHSLDSLAEILKEDEMTNDAAPAQQISFIRLNQGRMVSSASLQ
jgi:hypothetical protein